MRANLGKLLPLIVLAAGCGSAGHVKSAETGTFRVVGIGAALDPTVKVARLLPEKVDETASYGTEAGGGVRAITAGLRVVSSPDGAIVAAEDRLPQGPQITTALPERLGGGFLFVLGPTVWRADRWLAPAKPIFTTGQSQPITAIVPGLDRVYLKTPSTYLAIDGTSGKVLDLGPWPASPYVASYGAADGWRAAAVTDLRGVVATNDAGATWRTLSLPFDARTVIVSGDNLAIGGVENGHTEAWFEVRADGSVARLGARPREAKGKIAPAPAPAATARYPYGYPPGYGGYPVPPPYPTQPAPAASARPDARAAPRDAAAENEAAPDAGTKIFGKRPLAAAIEDGWPLTDGTAVVARDGALGRVRLADGALVELVEDAFPMKPSRCHPVSLTRANAIGAFGFVCGEPRGTTVVYAYEPLRGRLSEIKRFDTPRVVTSSGNGALAVRGGCAEDAEPPAAPRVEPLKVEAKDKNKKDDKAKDKKARTVLTDDDDDDDDDAKKPKTAKDKDTKSPPPAGLSPLAPAPEVRPYCVLGHDNVWREIHVRGDGGGERIVVLADGKIAVVSPPQSTNAPARLTILDKGKAQTVAVAFPKVTADVARVLRLGLWLDGFEERKPGVIGGWIEAGGAMLGIEIALDGKATLGDSRYLRDSGMPFVSGKYGLGWTASRRGYETVDGGMTWTPIDLPDPLATGPKVERRACGPIGCIANGWLRVGWGEAKKAKPPEPPPPYRASSAISPPHVALACEPVAGSPPSAPTPRVTRPSPAPPPPSLHRPYGGPPVLGGFNGSTELAPFFGQPAQTLHESDRGLAIDVRDLPKRYPPMGQLAKIYAWGPKTGDWDTLGRWQVKWVSPFAGWNDLRATVPVLPPQIIVDFTRSGAYSYSGYYGGYAAQYFQLVPGDDTAHALLIGRRSMNNQVVLFELEADRAPVELRRVDGEPFGEIESYVRAAGRWFFAMPVYGPNVAPATAIWQVDGAVARELTRVPRAGIGEGGRAAGSELARRSDGRAIGLVVDGQTTPERPTPVRWVLPIDLDSGQVGEPEPLGYNDLGGRTVDACSDDVVGWVLDAPLALGSNVRIKLPAGSGSIHSTYGRLRLTSARACIEKIAGTFDGQSTERAAQLTRGGASPRGTPSMRPGEILATAMSAQTRYALRCTLAK